MTVGDCSQQESLLSIKYICLLINQRDLHEQVSNKDTIHFIYELS